MLGYEDILNSHLKEAAEGIEIVYAGQSLPVLPFINGLRGIKAKKPLEVCHRHAAGDPEGIDISTGGGHVDGGDVRDVHGGIHEATSFNRLVGRVVFRTGAVIYNNRKQKSRW